MITIARRHWLFIYCCGSAMQVQAFTGGVVRVQSATLHSLTPLIATAEKACRTAPRKIRFFTL